MKRLIKLAFFISLSLVAQENPRPGKRSAQEIPENVQGESKVLRKEPEQITHSLASLPGLPKDLQLVITNYLFYAPGLTSAEQLFNAGSNIRNFFMTSKRYLPLLNDIDLAGQIIGILADLYGDGDVVQASLALGTNAASQWLANYTKEQFGSNPDGSLKEPESEEAKLWKYQIQAALDYAVNNQQIPILRFLLTHQQSLANWDINFRTGIQIDEMPFIDAAVEKNDLAMMRLLLKSGVKISDDNVIYAVGEGSVPMIELLEQAGIDINKNYVADKKPESLLFWVKSEEMANHLIKKGLDINVQNENGDTPLHRAVSDSQNDVAKALLNAGANKEIKNAIGKTPLDIAIGVNNLDAIKMLLEAGAIFPQEISFVSPLNMIISIPPLVHLINSALRAGREKVNKLIELLDLLIMHGANVNENLPAFNEGDSTTLLRYLKNHPRDPLTDLIISELIIRGAHE